MEMQVNLLEENLDCVALAISGVREEMQKIIKERDSALERAKSSEKVVESIATELLSNKDDIIEKIHNKHDTFMLVDQLEKRMYTVAVQEYSDHLYKRVCYLASKN
jgi:hypothetical protein